MGNTAHVFSAHTLFGESVSQSFLVILFFMARQFVYFLENLCHHKTY